MKLADRYSTADNNGSYLPLYRSWKGHTKECYYIMHIVFCPFRDGPRTVSILILSMYVCVHIIIYF